jgi:Mg/Co/Ni transporter MgtE
MSNISPHKHLMTHHPQLGDKLFRQIVELEVDARADLVADHRERCVKEILERMDADIQEHLAGGDLFPETLLTRVRSEVSAWLGNSGLAA